MNTKTTAIVTCPDCGTMHLLANDQLDADVRCDLCDVAFCAAENVDLGNSDSESAAEQELAPIANASRPVDADAHHNGETASEMGERIMMAAYAGYFVAGLTAVCSIFGFLGFSAWNFLDVFVVGGLALGVSRGSRTCAVLLFLLYTGGILLPNVLGGNTGTFGILMGLSFAAAFFRAIPATFKYHRA